jgi:conjugative relaxase-like TrwC/TraI family protein
VAAGQRRAVAVLAGQPVNEPAASYLVPLVDPDGTEWITDRELERSALARERGPVASEVASTGHPDDLLTVAEAARLCGLTAQYVRGLCRRWEDHRAKIEAALAEGRTRTRAYVVAWRGVKGKWLVKRGDLVAFLERRAAPAVRVGYDLTLTTEKSLGVLALLGDDHTRAAVIDAIQAGNDTGIGYLELHAASARRRGEHVLVRGLTVASFRHLTSRALDPFPHHHNVIANTVVDEHGSHRALDARGLYRHAQVASALATARMRHQLTMSLGVAWRPSRSGGWEIDGIPESVVREFSRRRNEIDEAVAELEEAIGRTKTVDELQSIVLNTRPAKEDVDPRELVAGWWDRAERHGLTPTALAGCTGRAARQPTAVDREAVFDWLASPDEGVCSGASVFTRSEVLVALVDLPVATNGGVQPVILSAAEVERLADDFLASAHVVQLGPPVPPHQGAEAIFTTREILAVQQRVLDRCERGRGTGAALVREASLVRAIVDAGRLSVEQADLVRVFCTSGDAVHHRARRRR